MTEWIGLEFDRGQRVKVNNRGRKPYRGETGRVIGGQRLQGEWVWLVAFNSGGSDSFCAWELEKL